MNLRHLLPFAVAVATIACSPSLDWREVRPADSGALLLFPCKPEIAARPATAAEPARMGLAQCKAAGLTFSLSWAELEDPAGIAPALQQMPAALAAKLEAKPGAVRPLRIAGMTPNPQTGRQSLAGTRQAEVAVFTRGRIVYQAVMLGAKRNEEAWDTFIGSIRLE